MDSDERGHRPKEVPGGDEPEEAPRSRKGAGGDARPAENTPSYRAGAA